jgi:ABC-2 type transport system ATP-binding protein
MIKIDAVSKRFGEVQAVDRLSLQVNPGEVFGLLGPNGSGKTTTVKMMMGLLTPDQGEIRVVDLDPTTDSQAVKAAIGYVSEESILFSSMTPHDTFELVIGVRKLQRERVQDWFERLVEGFSFWPYMNAPIATLSRGNRQKTEIIAALLHRPKILILDEPLSGLDATSVRVLKEILSIHTERGGCVLFSTHILEIAEEMCDRICVISDGTAVATGSMEELQAVSGQGKRSLEELFLELTDQDDHVSEIVRDLREQEE